MNYMICVSTGHGKSFTTDGLMNLLDKSQSISLVDLNATPEYKYRITVKYDNFPQSIIYRSTKTAQELMQWFLSDIRHGNPCLVQDISNKYPVVLNLGKANVIEITQLEE